MISPRKDSYKIFVSYDREDAGGWAGVIYQILKDRYGVGVVFKDEEESMTGTDWPPRLERLVKSCDVLILIIGPEWKDPRIIARLNDPTYLVHREIVTAIDANKVIFPVVIEGASVPTEAIPNKISQALNRHHFQVHRNTNFWQEDIERICADIEAETGLRWNSPRGEKDSGTAQVVEQTGGMGSRRSRWRTWIRRGVRVVLFATSLVILVLGAWELARWGLDDLNASTTVTRNSSLCEAVPGFGPEMIVVEGGEFQMRDDAGSASTAQQPVRTVTVKPFAIGTCEVTSEEYDRFAEATKRFLPDDEGWGRGRRPVINVSWDDAKAYAAWLSQQTGKRYRLPTEAEWEYAARSGGKDEAWAGTSNDKQLPDYAVYNTTRTEPVGGRRANGLGLTDMSGNVWEWVEDCWHEHYKDAPPDGLAWLEANGGDCGWRVIRGGSWGNIPETLRASNRDRIFADNRYGHLGFRLVQDMNE